MALIDGFGRHIDYLKISINGHYNLSCRCYMPMFSTGRIWIGLKFSLTWKINNYDRAFID